MAFEAEPFFHRKPIATGELLPMLGATRPRAQAAAIPVFVVGPPPIKTTRVATPSTNFRVAALTSPKSNKASAGVLILAKRKAKAKAMRRASGGHAPRIATPTRRRLQP